MGHSASQDHERRRGIWAILSPRTMRGIPAICLPYHTQGVHTGLYTPSLYHPGYTSLLARLPCSLTYSGEATRVAGEEALGSNL